ncbi:MAG: carbohydrate kinase family protein [Anaerolineae bacterium]|nr:carbohydrate kinase family protein [Anaerolineae bacterium]MCO5204735.1 carbohydrate kinase family protein [Anaerolineae bacterium]
MKVVITGSIAYDYLMSFPGKISDQFIEGAIEHVSLSFLVDSMKRQRGGTATNIAFTMGLLGGNPHVLATAGIDFGDYRTWLESHGVNTDAIIEIEDEFCASFFCTTDTSQNQIASFYPGAMGHAAMLSIPELAPDADLVIVSPTAPDAMEKYAQECRDHSIDFIFDPSQQTIRFNGDQLLHGLDGSRLLTVNEYEFGLIMDKTGLSEAEILGRTKGVLITKGSKGSLLRIDGEEHFIPTVTPYKVVEPTGAGDAFRAGLMRGMQLGLPWSICGRMGALAATYVLESFGTQNHKYDSAEFVTRYRHNFDDQGALDTLLKPTN